FELEEEIGFIQLWREQEILQPVSL
ncbi:unnamed protein product, partial [Didymodactylos carnosus]